MSTTESLASFDKEKQPQALTLVLPSVSEEKLHETEVGYDIYKETTEQGLEWTDREEGWILRRIDLWILPCFCIAQGLAFLDKTALNYGNLFGMKA